MWNPIHFQIFGNIQDLSQVFWMSDHHNIVDLPSMSESGCNIFVVQQRALAVIML